jgi:hypothetical protein
MRAIGILLATSFTLMVIGLAWTVFDDHSKDFSWGVRILTTGVAGVTTSVLIMIWYTVLS